MKVGDLVYHIKRNEFARVAALHDGRYIVVNVISDDGINEGWLTWLTNNIIECKCDDIPATRFFIRMKYGQ